MAKLPRFLQKVFGLNGDQAHFEQFGGLKAGSPLPSKDPATIQALDAFTNNGWIDAIIGGNANPPLEDMNALFLLAFRQIAYGFQEGIAEWESGTSYYVGSIVKKTGTFELYGSLTDNNAGNALPSQTDNGFWRYLNPPSVAPGVMADFGGTAAPLGWLLCDGSVVAQASYPSLFAAIGTAWNTGGEGGGNFRLPSLGGYATAGVGGTLGLSVGQKTGATTHTLTVAEMPSHTHSAYTVPAAPIVGTDKTTIAGASPGDFLPAVNAQQMGVGINNTGGDGAHNIVQPTACVNKIIKF